MRLDRQRILTPLLAAVWLLVISGEASSNTVAEEAQPRTRSSSTNSNTHEADLSDPSVVVDPTPMAAPPSLTTKGKKQQQQHYVPNNQIHKINMKNNTTDAFWRLEQFKDFRRQAAEARKSRTKTDRQQKARAFAQKLPKAPQGKVERVSPEEFAAMDQKQQLRGLNWWGGGSATSDAYSSSVLLDPSQYYDKWAQAYRMLGGFIDCDHDKSGDSHDSGGDNEDGNYNNNNGGEDTACSRWMMWAAVRICIL